MLYGTPASHTMSKTPFSSHTMNASGPRQLQPADVWTFPSSRTLAAFWMRVRVP